MYPLFGQAGNGFDKIIVSINCGVNNLGGGSDNAASTYPKMMNYISTILNQDSRTCVMVYTIINANPLYATKAEIDAYNALLLATTQTARLKVVNTTTEPLLTSVGACDNTTYYQADKVHLTQAGYNLLGALGQAVALTF